jgi:hypothetical protein
MREGESVLFVSKVLIAVSGPFWQNESLRMMKKVQLCFTTVSQWWSLSSSAHMGVIADDFETENSFAAGSIQIGIC